MQINPGPIKPLLFRLGNVLSYLPDKVIKQIFNYPPVIIERCDQLGLVDAGNKPGGFIFYTKKIVAMVLFGVLLGMLVRYVNGGKL